MNASLSSAFLKWPRRTWLMPVIVVATLAAAWLGAWQLPAPSFERGTKATPVPSAIADLAASPQLPLIDHSVVKTLEPAREPDMAGASIAAYNNP